MTNFSHCKCPRCQKTIIAGTHSWLGDCAGCNKSINLCDCNPVQPKGVSDREWKIRLLWQAIYRTGKFKFDDGCLTDEGLVLLKELEEIKL